MKSLCFLVAILIFLDLSASASLIKFEKYREIQFYTAMDSTSYSYDTAGNRINRLGGATSGCLNAWTGNIDSKWSTAGNWSLGIVPQPCHKVVISTLTSKPYPVLDVNTSITGIQFNGGFLTYSDSANGYKIMIGTDPGCAVTCPN